MKRLFTLIATLLVALSQADAKEWSAQWIMAQNTPTKSKLLTNTWYCFHKSVDLPAIGSQSVYADIAVDSKYWMWINGEMVVFEGQLKRGPSPRDTYYDHVDITSYLNEGRNDIAILVWYFGNHGNSHNSSGKPALLFDCRADGFTILSDNTWSATYYSAYEQTRGTQPNERLAEGNIRFNAQREAEGWTAKGATPSFAKAVEVGKAGCEPWNNLIERPIPFWKDSGLVEYESIEQQESGDYIVYTCHLPYNCHVTPWLDIEASAGKVIHIQTDNYMGGSYPNLRSEYVTKQGSQQYESLGWINGHAIIYRIPKDIKVNSLRYRETGFNTELTGTFNCDDDFFNRFWQKAARTLYVTMRDTYMDCPDRERAQWWGDVVIEQGEAFYALDTRSHTLTYKGILELMNWQRADGTIFSPCPSGRFYKEYPSQMLASVGYYGFYTYYLYSGDDSFIPVVYDRIHRYLHDVWQMDSDGLVIHRKGGSNWGDWGDNIDIELLLNCWYYLALQAEREFALMLDKQSDLEMIEAKMAGMRQSFNRRYWTGKEYRSPKYKETTDDRAQAMAVLAGFAPEEYYPAILEVLKREHHASPYMEKYIDEALFRMGYADYALERARKRFDAMVNHPTLTTLWEGWRIGDDDFGGGTINHAWSGGMLTLLSQYVVGISPIEAGFKEFRVAPQMGTLNRAEVSFDTHYGTIRASLLRHDGTIDLRLTVPEGTIAHLTVDGEPRTYRSGEHHITLTE